MITGNRFKNLTGKKFGKLFVLYTPKKATNGNYLWKCLCDCGNYTVVRSAGLQSGNTKSCGCLQRDSNIVHGMYYTRIYHIWSDMIQRCTNNKTPNFKRYGKNGIKVCSEWNDATTFIKWALANGYTDKLTIDRIDSKGNYEPSNCQWITGTANSKKMWAERRLVK